MIMKVFLFTILKLGLRVLYAPLKLFKTKNRIVYLSRQSNDKSVDMRLLEKAVSEEMPDTQQVFRLRMIPDGLGAKIKYCVAVIGDMYYLSTSKLAILDTYSITVSCLKHKKELKVIQMWHALGAFKKFGKSLNDTSESKSSIKFLNKMNSIKLAEVMKMHNNYNYILVSSKNIINEYKEAFGYTEEELSEYFRDGIDEYLSRHKEETKDEFIESIRNYYDGYRFSPWSEKAVYNPVSIGMFFNSGCRFENYWDKTGVSTMAVNLALQKDLTGLLSADCYVSLSSFYAFDVSSIQNNLKQDEALVLLYYAGYLTIKNYTDSILFLDFPNLEVAGSFTKNLVSRYMETGLSQVDFWIMQFRSAAREGNEETVKEKLTDYFDAFSYEMTNQKENERFYHGIFHAIFVMAGTYAVSEDRGPRGRADEVIITDEHIWIFELKIDKSADEALKQIENKGYAEKYAYLMNINSYFQASKTSRGFNKFQKSQTVVFGKMCFDMPFYLGKMCKILVLKPGKMCYTGLEQHV